MKKWLVRLATWLRQARCAWWWPQWLCLTNPPMAGVVFGVALGAAISWFIYAPQALWMKFDWLTATYVTGSDRILLAGLYEVGRPCDAPVIWRTEALATDGQIAVYGPSAPGLPPLTVGEHAYEDAIALLEPIFPDGWRVTVIVTCTSEPRGTVASPSVPVEIQPASWPGGEGG